VSQEDASLSRAYALIPCQNFKHSMHSIFDLRSLDWCWKLIGTGAVVNSPRALSIGGLVMGFVGLCWGFTPTRKSNLMLTCGGASMLTPKTCINKGERSL
jgi:hypothetical protein